MHVAASFGYPFRRGSVGAWIAGIVLLALFPVTFVLLFGYVVGVIRNVARDAAAPPPRLSVDRRLLRDGALVALAAALAAGPYLVLVAVAAAGLRARLPAGIDPLIGGAETALAAAFLVGVPWGTAVLLFAPPALAAFASTGRARDLFDPVAAGAAVRRSFLAWNLVTVAIVTAWVIALASAGILCLGFLPGAFYAILVSAHATASLVEAPPPGAEAAPAG